MCGIGGVIATDRVPDPAVLTQMGAAMRHRGPDGGNEEAYGRAGLVVRRLSIVDRSGGAQPIANEDGSCHIVLNGEIYNYRALQTQLEARGHRFRTNSDVECVIHGYEEFGDDVVLRLRGMFAFAIYDGRRERLLLARDRLGKKPLLYWHGAPGLSFASELRALLEDPRVPRELDLEAIHHYLTYQYVPAPWTVLRGVYKLPPAHLLIYERGRVHLERYWKLRFWPTLSLDSAEAAQEVRRILRESVQLRLIGEVPIGAFLSGGLDSSAVTATMSEFGPVTTFSLGFDEPSFDERSYARLLAQRYDTRHHEFIADSSIAEFLPKLVEHYGEPFADASALPTYYLASQTAPYVKVVLNGDGGDELFGGYVRYRALGWLHALTRIPGASALSKRVLPFVEGALPASARALLVALAPSASESYGRMISCFTPEEKAELYASDMAAVGHVNTYSLLNDRYSEADGPDILARTLYVDTLTYLPDDLLVKMDIATMAHGLEARSPLLDHELVEFVARLPSRFKRSHGLTKVILRQAMADLLPDEILSRPKWGFAVPVDRWLRTQLRPLLRETLLSSHLVPTLFRHAFITRLIDEHEGSERNHSHKLWTLLMLELWRERFFSSH